MQFFMCEVFPATLTAAKHANFNTQSASETTYLYGYLVALLQILHQLLLIAVFGLSEIGLRWNDLPVAN